MTVSSETSKSGPYTGNGVTLVFSYGFRILDETHVSVVRTEAGLDSLVTTGFTVSGVGNAGGGAVTFDVAPTASQKITLIRAVPKTQELDLVNQGAYFAEDVEEAFDLAAMRDQQLQEQVDRSLKIPVGRDASTLDGLIEDVIRLNDSADEIDTVAGIAADVTTVAGIAADVNTVAGMADDVTNFADVYLGPSISVPTTRADGNPLLDGDLYFDMVSNRLQVWTGSEWVAAASTVNGTLQREVYTATAAQTVFAAVYDIGFVDVWLNGIKLVADDDFTATNGTTVVLTVGATAGDSVDIVAFGAFVVADMLRRPGSSGLVAHTGLDATAARTITAGTGIAVTNGDGVAGNPVVAFDGSIGTVAITATADADGTFSSGTYTPTPVGGNFKTITNGGAFTLAAPTVAGDYNLIILITNNGTAGAVTFSGFTKTAGDPLTTTDGHQFTLSVVKLGAAILLVSQGLQ